MSLFDWLRNLASTASSSPPAPNERKSSSPSASPRVTDVGFSEKTPAPASEGAPVLTEVEKAAMVIGGLNFMDAITAHQKWKTRLTMYLGGAATEKLDYRVVCRDDQCVLGKWINGEGGDTYGHMPLFSQLKMTHAQFHLTAGNIVRFQDEGKSDQAQDALRHGEYPQHSIKVQGLLSSLYLEVKGEGRDLG